MLDLIFNNLLQRKLRTSLTVLGVALGIFALVVMGAMSEQFRAFTENSMSLTGDKIRVMGESGFMGGGISNDMVNVVRRVPGVKDAYGILQAPLDKRSYGMLETNVVVGIPPEKLALALKDTRLSGGRYLVPGDTYVALMGSSVTTQFNLGIGDTIEIHDKNFVIVGTIEYTASFFDNAIIVPLDKSQEVYERRGLLTMIFVIPDNNVEPETLAQQIELSVKGVNAFPPTEIKKQINQQLMIFILVTASAAIIAALVGGLSVTNTMLTAVSERTWEIGLFKALGAETRFILLMMIGEAMVIGILGGIFGILTGLFTAQYLNIWLEAKGTKLFLVTQRLMSIAFIFAILLSIFSGLYPAYRAAKMSPMKALRHE